MDALPNGEFQIGIGRTKRAGAFRVGATDGDFVFRRNRTLGVLFAVQLPYELARVFVVNRYCKMIQGKHRERRGVSVTEVLMAATLIVSAIGLIAPLSVRIGRVWQSTRQYRLAFNELANQMEWLTSLDSTSCEAVLPSLRVSDPIADSLPGSQLKGELMSDEDGTRLILRLDWDRGSKSEPLTLVGWLGVDGKVVEQGASQ